MKTSFNMLFDTHVHLNAEQFDEDVEEVIARAKEAGVENMVVVGFDRPTIEMASCIGARRISGTSWRN